MNTQKIVLVDYIPDYEEIARIKEADPETVIYIPVEYIHRALKQAQPGVGHGFRRYDHRVPRCVSFSPGIITRTFLEGIGEPPYNVLATVQKSDSDMVSAEVVFTEIYGHITLPTYEPAAKPKVELSSELLRTYFKGRYAVYRVDPTEFFDAMVEIHEHEKNTTVLEGISHSLEECDGEVLGEQYTLEGARSITGASKFLRMCG